MESDSEWIEKARRGDGAALAAIVAEHQALVYRVSLAVLGDPQEADEAAQDVFVRMYERLGSFRGESRLSTWLYRVALNICADRLRSRRWRRWLGLNAAEVHGHSRDRPDQWMENRESLAALRAALARLPEKFRDVLILRELEEREYAEIADILGVSIGTVESRLFRAREKLKTLLSEGESR